jgi:predicted phosphodiesterase
MIITLISDTHTKHHSIPEKYLMSGDMIIHSGDVSSRGSRTEIENFLEWYNELPYTYKIFIAGNHDFFFEQAPEYEIESLLSKYPNIIYLNDSGIEIEGLKIWGSPIQPYFRNWAFNRKGEDIIKHWDLIPTDIDILITHGPMYGYLDRTKEGELTGCPYLLDKVKMIDNLILFQFGHIHEANGVFKIDNGPLLVNASVLNRNYDMTNIPYNITLDKDKKIIDIK